MWFKINVTLFKTPVEWDNVMNLFEYNVFTNHDILGERDVVKVASKLMLKAIGILAFMRYAAIVHWHLIIDCAVYIAIYCNITV